MKKIILGMMLVFMSIFVTPCRGAVSSSNSETLEYSVSQESKDLDNNVPEKDDGYMVVIAGLLAIVLFGWYICTYQEHDNKNW